MGDWQKRLVEERSELLKKLLALVKFSDNPESKLNKQEWEMLQWQCNSMREYCRALTQRCKYYGLIEATNLDIY